MFPWPCSPYDDPATFFASAASQGIRTFPALGAAVRAWRWAGSSRHGSLWLPQAFLSPVRLIPTPTDGGIPWNKKDWLSEYALATITSLLGRLLAYPEEQQGAAIRQICPNRAHAGRLTNQDAEQELGWHTENAWHQNPPDYIVLACLRADPARQATTSMVSLDALCAHLPRELLETPMFSAARDTEYGPGPAAHVALLAPQDRPRRLRLDTTLMAGTTPMACDMLTQLRHACAERSTHLKLAPGDMLVLDNREVAHNRSAFPASYDGTDRWLQQCYVVRT